MTIKPFKNTSATQNEIFRRCERKWYFDHTVGRGPQTAAMIRGSGIHDSFLEGFLRTGELRQDDWLMYSRALKNCGYFPEYGKRDYRTETRITMPTLEGLPPWVGYVDCATDEPDAQDANIRLLRIQDLKTTSDLRWTKTREELRDDTQMMSYAHWGFEEMNADRVVVEHVVLEVRQPPPKRVPPRINHVSVEVDREHVADRWDAEMMRLTRMAATLTLADSYEDVEPTGAPSECKKYGGCQHRALCGIDAAAGRPIANLLNPKKKDGTMPEESDFMRKLRLKKEAQEAAKNGGETEKTVEFEEEEEESEEEEAATLAPDAASRTDDAPDESGDDDEEDEIAAMEAKVKKAKAAKKKKEAVVKKAKVAAEKKAKADAAAAKKKAAVKPPKTKAKPPTKAAPPKKPGGSFALFIGCAPVKGANSMVHFEDWIAPIVEALNEWVQENHRLPDYRMMSFSDEKSAFDAAIKEFIGEHGLPTTMVMLGTSPLQNDALPALVPHATVLVRATR